MRKKIQVSITKSEKRNITKSTKKIVDNFKLEIDQYYDENGFVSFSARSKKYTILGTNSPKEGICECPECHKGQLSVIKSFTTKKRFIGCTNFQNGCKASAPLLQKAMLGSQNQMPRVSMANCNFQIFKKTRVEKTVCQHEM